MVPIILDKRKSEVKSGKSFNKLVAYVIVNNVQEKLKPLFQDQKFDDVLNYTTTSLDKKNNQEKCTAIRTRNVTDISSAAIEMNAVAARNTRCKDPAFHLVLSWHERDHISNETIFDAAEHAINALDLAEHQYVLAIHSNTDNPHCHIAVNRIHPVTFKSRNIEWAKKTLHLAARQSEIKHGWSHDNGIYIVETNDKNIKTIVLNPDFDHTLPDVHLDLPDDSLPTWHDPDGLDSWLKTKVARALKRDIPTLTSWYALHSWLDQYDITLTDSGGGGMRLHATSPETGEILDLPCSRGLRILKRDELEKRWGAFTNSTPTPCIVPDLSHLTHKQIAKGVNNFLRKSFDKGVPPNHIRNVEPSQRTHATGRSGGLHDVSFRGLDGERKDGAMLLPDAQHHYMGNEQTWQDQDMRRSGTSETGSRRSLTRDNSKREERKQQRTAARADLRLRFSQYKRLVRQSDPEHWKRIKEIQLERSQALKIIREQIKSAKYLVDHNRTITEEDKLFLKQSIVNEGLRKKLVAEVNYQKKGQSQRLTRLPPLGWRVWLHEQSNLGDQAALSALRGIVYQAQRDALRDSKKRLDDEELEADTTEGRERQYRKVMARLLEEEKNEIAIRSARSNFMRPYEADALLARYIGIQWRVTGNGNIEFSERNGEHLFTDRGNRVTFDRARVPDDDIRLALAHAQQKFGNQVTLTGDDPAFTKRMARLAVEMGMDILNPELQSAIENQRTVYPVQITEATTIVPTINEHALLNKSDQSVGSYAKWDHFSQEPDQGNKEEIPLEQSIIQTPLERLRAIVLSIDPRAKFVIPDPTDSHRLYPGSVAATLDMLEGSNPGFAQHIGRGVYALHQVNAPEHHNDAVIEVRYSNGHAVVTIPVIRKEKGR